jgi:hypothetical protein
MSRYYIRETFFRPPEHARERSALPAPLYNNLQAVFRRAGRASLFIPIRAMQFQAVAEREEIVFVDSHGGYAHQNGEGGRLIRIAWRLPSAASRESLDTPVPCEIVYYFSGLQETQRRLMSELPPVLKQILQRHREKEIPSRGVRVVPLRPSG